MKICFLYPGVRPHDALPNWVAALRRHCKEHEVVQATSVAGCAGADVVLALTQREEYPPARIDDDLAALRRQKVPFGVAHNQDSPAVPARGDYPSFAWTFAAHEKLRKAGYDPKLVRMPVLPPAREPTPGEIASLLGMGLAGFPLHVATFGAAEPKKHTIQMAQWCKANGVMFTCYAPGCFAEEHQDYHDRLRKVVPRHDDLVVHPWAEKVEDLAYLFTSVSHFLFVLPPGKGGPGGSPTSCRYATAFGRPVVVIDDENTYALDGFTVRRSLAGLTVEDLRAAELPNYDWLPDRYVGRLASLTLAHWGKA